MVYVKQHAGRMADGGSPTVTVGERIRSWRQTYGWSQEDVADRVGVSQRQVSRIERDSGYRVDRPTMIRIAEVLETPIASGEVNIWLTRSGLAPLVRPNLPLPPTLLPTLADDAPCFVFDPLGQLRACSPTAVRLVDRLHPPWDAFNLVTFSVRDAMGLRDMDRERLWHWVVLGALWAPAEPWAHQVRGRIEQYWQRPLAEVWAELSDTVAAYGPQGPVPVRTEQATLHFLPMVELYPLRPDLRVLRMAPADRATALWCRGTPQLPLAEDA